MANTKVYPRQLLEVSFTFGNLAVTPINQSACRLVSIPTNRHGFFQKA